MWCTEERFKWTPAGPGVPRLCMGLLEYNLWVLLYVYVTIKFCDLDNNTNVQTVSLELSLQDIVDVVVLDAT